MLVTTALFMIPHIMMFNIVCIECVIQLYDVHTIMIHIYVYINYITYWVLVASASQLL